MRITGILFGLLIKEQLVSSITLGIALRYVLEALRKSPSQSPQSGKMFRFGMFALEQFKERLHEWPQYCSHIVQIPHLRDGYAALVGEIEDVTTEGSLAQQAIIASTRELVAPGSGGLTPAYGPGSNRPGSAGDAASGSNPGALGGNIAVPNPASVVGANAFAATGSTFTALKPGGPGAAGGPTNIELPAPAVPLNLKKAVFGPGLGRAVNAPVPVQVGEGGPTDPNNNEAPPDIILDRVQFLINNLSMSNCESKSHELREMLERKYFGWLGNYLVVKRISTQPNFHGLYLSFLDNLGMDYGRGLVEAILASVYVNVGKLLRSQKITTSTSERSLLKNLGSWLGQITLARNRPILQVMLDCKELLFQGYETGMLIAVTPFVAKILEGAKNSTVFRPPNPWLMGLLSVFRALYNVDDLKMNIKFEVEVLCKNLGLRLEDIPMRKDADLSRRVSPVKEKNPDFNLKAASASATPSKAGQGLALSAANSMLSSPDNKTSSGASTGEDTAKSGGTAGSNEQQQTVIPNLAAYVNVNPNLTQLFHSVQNGPLATKVTNELLKQKVPIAVDRAIREIIQPVVERSVSIACITSKSIVTKDFAMESDENKMRKASMLMVANLAGSLALVTCREPLHTSISTHLRNLLIKVMKGSNEYEPELEENEKNALTQLCAICSTENLELGCMLIEKAATEKAIRDMDEAIAPALALRKNTREQKGHPYYDMSIFEGGQRYPKELPDQLRPKPIGLRQDQLFVYEAFQRIPRQPTAPDHAAKISDGQEQSELNLNAINAISVKLDNSVTTLLNTAGQRASEISLAMIPPQHEIKQLISAVPRVVAAAGTSAAAVTDGSDPSRAIKLSTSDTDQVLSFSQGIFKRLYEVNLSERLRLEALISLLEAINKFCPQLGRDMGTWATYAPVKSDGQRKLHRAVLLLLVRAKLIDITDLDAYLTKQANEGRDQVWLEFLILFVRTAVLEKIASPRSMPKMVNVVQLIAEDRSPASQEIDPTYRQATIRLLEELRVRLEQEKQELGPTYEESSSMSPASLRKLTDASLAIAKSSLSLANSDPPNAKQLVAEVLVHWLKTQYDAASNDKIMAQFLQQLQTQFGVGTDDEQTERFLRLTTWVVIESCRTNVNASTKKLNFQAVDGWGRLLSHIVRYMNSGGAIEQVSQQRLTMLNKILGVTTRSLITEYEKAQQTKDNFDQRPWYRLFLDLIIELNQPNPAFDPIKSEIVGVFGSALHVVQPLVVPGVYIFLCFASCV